MSTTSANIPAASSAVASPSGTSSDDTNNCGSGGGDHRFTSLRIASVFVILVTSMSGALFPVIARRTRLSNVIPKTAFECVSSV